MNWKLKAACRGSDPGVFYPEHEERDTPTTRAAKAICATCTVGEQCEALAIENLEQFGIWNGKTPLELGTKYLRRCTCGNVFEVPKQKGHPRAHCSKACKDDAREAQKWDSYDRLRPTSGLMLALGHGTISRYQRGCKCASCRKASRVYRAEMRAKKRAA